MWALSLFPHSHIAYNCTVSITCSCALPYRGANPKLANSFVVQLCLLQALHNHCTVTLFLWKHATRTGTALVWSMQKMQETFHLAWQAKVSNQQIVRDSPDRRDFKCLFWLYKFYETAVPLFAWVSLCALSCATSHQTRAAPACLHCRDSWEGFHSHSQQSVGQDCKLMLKDDILSWRTASKWPTLDDL